MNELIEKVEQWAHERNIIKGSKPIDQAMKLFSEAGELADNIGKGRDCRDDIGDVLTVLIIIRSQLGMPVQSIGMPRWAEGSNKELVVNLISSLATFVQSAQQGVFASGILTRILNILNAIASNNKTTLQECLQVAYDDIKDRKGIMANGLFIKESDPAYSQVIAEIEANLSV